MVLLLLTQLNCLVCCVCVWIYRPSISQKSFTLSVRRSKSAGHGARKEMKGIAIARKMSENDMYGVDGSEFRSSTMGTGYEKHEAAELSNLPANMRRQYEAALQKKRSKAARTETKKSRWNASPHVVPPVDVKLKDSPFKKFSYEQFHEKTKTMGQEQVKKSYKSSPFQVVLPKQVMWEKNKKMAKQKWGSVKLHQAVSARLRIFSPKTLSIPGGVIEEDEGGTNEVLLPALATTV